MNHELIKLKRKVEAQLRKYPGVVSVAVGYRYKSGKRTGEVCIVVGVERKKPLSRLLRKDTLPTEIEGVRVDVVQYGRIKALGLTARVRPCPGGYSCGHPQITAGTLGCWVKRGAGSESYVLSNNHVLANSNAAALGDPELQPGAYDGGQVGRDAIAKLAEFARINFAGQDGNGGCSVAKAFVSVLNAAAKLLGRSTRLAVRQIDQPTPNLVDAAVARADSEELVDARVEYIGPVVGIRDLKLGDRVTKVGRTTGLTTGSVTAVDGSVSVSYGDAKTAEFAEQVFISADEGEFSAGGDSGSVILTEDNYLGGLLFAGGEGVTVANRIANVVSLLGIRL